MPYLLSQIDELAKESIASDFVNIGLAQAVAQRKIEDIKTWAVDSSSGNYLIIDSAKAREEFDNVKYLLKFKKLFYKIRKLSVYRDDDVSFQHFPSFSRLIRDRVEQEFQDAISVFGVFGFGQDGRAFGNEYKNQAFNPRFVKDDISPPSM